MRAVARLLWRLAQQVLLAARERPEELVMKIVAISEHNERRVLHGRLEHNAAGVESHREALARSLRVPHHADAAAALGPRRYKGCFNGATDGVELVVSRHLLRDDVAVVL